MYWVQSDRIGMASISDLAGASTMKQGMYGAVVVAPASTVSGQVTTFTDPVSGQPRDIGPQVLVHVPGADVPHYRDFSVIIADDDAAIGQDFMPYPTNATTGKSLVNYQAAPAGDGPTAFRSPGSVPWLTALAGDPVVVHAMVSPGSENAHVFTSGRPALVRGRLRRQLELDHLPGDGPVGDLHRHDRGRGRWQPAGTR